MSILINIVSAVTEAPFMRAESTPRSVRARRAFPGRPTLLLLPLSSRSPGPPPFSSMSSKIATDCGRAADIAPELTPIGRDPECARLDLFFLLWLALP